MYISPTHAAESIGISASQFSTLRTVLRPAIPTARKPRTKPGRPEILLSASETVNWLCQIMPDGLSANQRREIFARAVIL